MARPTLIFYHVPGDGDEEGMPNAFPILKSDGRIFLQDIRGKFPLPGTYHFRFKMKWGSEVSQVAWMDVTNEASQVPMIDGKVICKVTRVSWEAKNAKAAAAPAASPTNGVQAKPAQPPPPPADMGLFDDHPAPGRSTAPSAPTDMLGGPAPASAPGKKANDDFDMLFG
eukprot:TRINITY_DN39774_c7_g1_i1.p1 TRINITY_DN39774_c7_g1~~TRINITY_DN39774_c7_g1_i1.p1  ORF type:complete len:169 (+),score=36.79 TRINITY_DN39774_c7_g1_i1:64-570(+)